MILRDDLYEAAEFHFKNKANVQRAIAGNDPYQSEWYADYLETRRSHQKEVAICLAFLVVFVALLFGAFKAIWAFKIWMGW
jgi:hypothetical protein